MRSAPPLLICVLCSFTIFNRAHAATCHDGSTGTDGDSDGWCLVDTPISDCNDGLATFSPMDAEDGIDGDDEDCDGSVLIHRTYISSMNSLFGTDFTLGTGAALSTSGDDVLTMTVGAAATANKVDDFAFDSGLFTVIVRVKAVTGAPSACTAKVTSTSMAETSLNFSGTGTKTMTWPAVEPGDVVTDVKLACASGTGSVVLDWLSVSNGTYRFGPMNDVSTNATTMGLPATGRQSVVRASDDGTGAPGSLMFVGSDVGGFGWSQDGDTWKAANGVTGQWLDYGELGVWEAWAVDESPLSSQSVLVLTGEKDSADNGGLYYTDNLDSATQVWTLANGGLGASKHIDDCSTLSFKPISSGRLIVPEPSDTTFTRFLVASNDPDTRGLWIWDKDSTDSFFTTPYLQRFNSSLPDAPPSALAIDASGTYLLVGYRPVTTGSEQGALFICPADFDSDTDTSDSTGDDCTLVAADTAAVWSGDVRDIEGDPNQDGTFYVADGGRRWGGTTCTTEESSVFVVIASGAIAAPTIDIYDTDDDTLDAMPSWGGSTGDYFGPYGCYDNNAVGADIRGELVPPRGTDTEGSELSSIALDPAGEYLFAFYPVPDSVREYGCVRTFRVPVADLADEATPWLPFPGWDYEDMAFYEQTISSVSHPPSPNAEARRAHIGVEGASAEFDAFMVSEPLLEDWAGAATHDAAFVMAGASGYDLLLGGNFLWRVLAANGTAGTNGWNTLDPTSVADTTLDALEWELAWDGEGSVFQDTTANAIAVCPGCKELGSFTLDLTLAAGVSDYKMARLYGTPSTASRPAASRSCETHKLDGSGSDVSIWDDGANGQAWLALTNQDDSTDATRNRGLLYSGDITTDEWCWDSVEAGGIAGTNYLKDGWTAPTTMGADGWYEFHCQDSSLIAEYYSSAAEWWGACDPSTSPYNLGDSTTNVGQVVSLAAIADATAVLAAAPGSPSGGGTAGKEGLWLAEYNSGTGITYTEIAYETAGVTFGSNNCSEADFFAWTSQVQVVFDPTSDGTGTARAYLSSRHADCGVMEVEWDVTDPADATTSVWTAVSLGSCSLDVINLRGVALDRDASWLLAFGGPDTSAGNGAADGGVCAIDLLGVESPEQVVDGDALDIQLEAGLAHPHLDDTFYVAGYTGDGSGDAGGAFTLQRRYRPDLADWNWAWRRLSGNDLEHRRVADIAWGTGNLPLGNKLRNLYLATAGGGFWDLVVVSE